MSFVSDWLRHIPDPPMRFTTKCAVIVCDGTKRWEVECPDHLKHKAVNGKLEYKDIVRCKWLVVEKTGCGDCSLCALDLIADSWGSPLAQFTGGAEFPQFRVPCKCFVSIPEFVSRYGACLDCVAARRVTPDLLNDEGRKKRKQAELAAPLMHD